MLSKKNIAISFIFVLIIATFVFYSFRMNKTKNILCQHSQSICSQNQLTSSICHNANNYIEQTKTCLLKSHNCLELEDCLKTSSQKKELNKKDLNINCQTACQNYVDLCLDNVPVAGIKKQGFDSCQQECKNWTEEKLQCLESAMTCEAMTDVCGL